jgi:hypothetical protein
MKLVSKKVVEKRGWMYEDVKDKKITRVQNKEDGSIISFVKIGGKVRAKSKMSFESEQAVMAQKVYDTSETMNQFVQDCLYADITPIFELVSPENQIVLEYQETKLILLQVRSNDGMYFDKEEIKQLTYKTGFDSKDIEIAEDFNIKTLESIAKKYTEDELEILIKDKEFEDISEFVSFINP